MKNILNNNIYIAFLLLVLTSCSEKKKSSDTTEIHDETETNLVQITKEQFENSIMELGTLQKHEFNKTIQTNGHIDVPPANKAQVSAKIGGYVKQSALLVGDYVKKGQVLASIENLDIIELQQNYLEIHEQLSFLKAEYERQIQLYKEKISSEKSYLKAESTYKSNLAVFNGLKQKLQLLNISTKNIEKGIITSQISIYAPISGNITKVFTSVGKYMSASDPLFEIIDNTHKHLELTVFEKDVFNLKKDQKIIFKTPENSAQNYFGEVHLIGNAIDEENRTVVVHGHLNDENNPFLVGMYVEANIVVDSQQMDAIKNEAILEEGERYYVFTLIDFKNDVYRFEKVEITIVNRDETHSEIISKTNDFSKKQLLVKGIFSPIEEGESGHSH